MAHTTPRDAAVEFRVDDRELAPERFIDLAQWVWPGDYDPLLVAGALRRTLNITAWHQTY